jgi:anhydro-N-acetylmuramic acid kinase
MLRGALARAGRKPTVDLASDHGMPVDCKEAVAFAVLAVEAICGRRNHLPRCTGAASGAVLGKIAPGANYATLMTRLWGRRGTG